MQDTIDTLPPVVPPLPREKHYQRPVSPHMVFDWLAAGWRDLMKQPLLSIGYGITVFLISLAIVAGLLTEELDYILFPALAGFLVVGPIIAVGLYEKSRRFIAGQSVTLRDMIFVRPVAGGQIVFTGALLVGLMLLWMRTAVIIYALFFGLTPFPGLDHIIPMLIGTPTGWTMLVVGTLIGGLFAALSFAVSVFSIPMMLESRVDALTAMGTSVALVWHNLPVMLTWGVIVLALFLLCVATGFLGLVLVFPLLGHATWHVYKAFTA